MTLVLRQSATAIGPRLTVSFLGVGGTGPYVYAVLPGGAGGTVNPSTGVYTAPAQVPDDASKVYDTLRVMDSLTAQATAQVLVASPLMLVCDIIQKEMGLANGRVYVWDQKILQPTDSGLYVAVSVVTCKPFANVIRQAATGTTAEQFVSMKATLDIDIISRGLSARDRKEEILLALGSQYAESQQEANSFYIARLPVGFVNLSNIDGAAIPYRYKISVNIQYTVAKTKAAPYFDQFTDTVYTNQ